MDEINTSFLCILCYYQFTPAAHVYFSFCFQIPSSSLLAGIGGGGGFLLSDMFGAFTACVYSSSSEDDGEGRLELGESQGFFGV